MSDQKPEHEVGYGRPPKHSRFRPGQSGNPKGRRRGQPNLITDLTKELAEQIRIREGDQVRSVTKQRAMVKALVAKSLKGEARAAALLIGLLVKLGEDEAEAAHVAKPGRPLDRQIIDDFLKRATSGGTGGQEGGDA